MEGDGEGGSNWRIRIFDATAGAILGSDATGVTILPNPDASSFDVGGTGSLGSVYGNLDDIQIWKRALSVADIDAIRAGTFGT